MEKTKRPYDVYLPEFLGLPKFFVAKIYGKANDYAAWDKWFDFNEVDEKMGDLSREWWDLESSGKIRAADLWRFKMRFYGVLTPLFDVVDKKYRQAKKAAKTAQEAEKASLLWQAHFFAIQGTLEYVDFFFWREGKFKNLPTNLKISYKPTHKADDNAF